MREPCQATEEESGNLELTGRMDHLATLDMSHCEAWCESLGYTAGHGISREGQEFLWKDEG